jgi:hypothetical protein
MLKVVGKMFINEVLVEAGLSKKRDTDCILKYMLLKF